MPDAPSVAELGLLLGAEVIGDAELRVRGIAALAHAGPDAISFLAHPRYAAQLHGTQAGCVILACEHREAAKRLRSALVVADPYAAYAALSRWWAGRLRERPTPGVHPSAVVAQGAMLHPEVCVGPLAVIGEGAQIESGCEIGPQAVIGAKVRVGADSRVGARVHLGDGVSVGQRAILHPGAVLGADGFGFAPREGRWDKIEQLGGVRLGDDVEVGANTCIDRGALDDTVIGNGVKLDNLIQIGHNVQVGDHTAMAGCVGIAGSARIGAHCTLGGGAIVLGHLELADHVHISAATVVTRSIVKPGHYSGVFPFEENALWERNAATLRQLYSLRRRLQALEGRGS